MRYSISRTKRNCVINRGGKWNSTFRRRIAAIRGASGTARREKSKGITAEEDVKGEKEKDTAYTFEGNFSYLTIWHRLRQIESHARTGFSWREKKIDAHSSYKSKRNREGREKRGECTNKEIEWHKR